MNFIPHPNQPIETQIYEAHNLWVKQMRVPVRGTIMPQHSHSLSHLTMIATGGATVWVDGKWLGNFDAPCGVYIEAGKKHIFVTKHDNTVLYCIHELGSPEALKVLEENNIV